MTKRAYVVKKNRHLHLFSTGKRPPSGQLDIELTERCNNACIHCCINKPAEDESVRSRELDTRAWKDILQQAADLGIMTIRYTGGEPLIREDFPELYLFTRRLGMRVLLFTNARSITPQIADLLRDIPPLEDIEISVYGMKRKSYEAVTGVAGSHMEFRFGVQRLVDRKIGFVVKGALLPPNKHETEAFASWAAANTRTVGDPSQAMFFNLRERRDSEEKNRRIRSLRVTPEESLSMLKQHPEIYQSEIVRFFERFTFPPSNRLFTCKMGHGCVDAYGVFQPCLSLRHPDLTFDLKKGSLREAWTSRFAKLKWMRATNPKYLERCARCFLNGLCEQCPANSWSEHGTLDTPVEYFCRIAHAQARFLGLLSEEERAWEVPEGEKRIHDLKRSLPAL